MSTGNVGPYTNLPVVIANRAAEEAAATEPTAEQAQIAKDFPPGMVQLENKGLKLGLQIPGGLLALGGATLLGISLLSRRAPGAAESRMLASPLLIGGGLIGAGAASVVGAELLPPKSKLAVATNIPTQARAGEVAGSYVGRQMKVVQDIAGKWAVIDEGPARSGGGVGGSYGYERGRGHYYGDGHFHGQHYYGDGHYHPRDYYEPYYPTNDYYPIPYDPPSYPSNPYPGGGTSGGDDYDYNPPSYPSNPGGGTSSGDDGGSYNPPSSYDPPSYDPPSYDPPSYDPPSYDPPSYDPPSYDPPSYDPPSYDPPSYDSGNSSSNGNPDYDDF